MSTFATIARESDRRRPDEPLAPEPEDSDTSWFLAAFPMALILAWLIVAFSVK